MIEPPNPSPRTPVTLRLAIASVVCAIGLAAYFGSDGTDVRVRSAIGIICFIGLAASCSRNLMAVNWWTIGWGLAFQFSLAFFILNFEISGLAYFGIPDGFRPGYELFRSLAEAVKQFLAFTDAGSRFVFGPVADPAATGKAFGPGSGFPFAFAALPTIIFVSAFFTVLYYFGVLQLIVRMMAKVMMLLMRTSGAETLSSAANVFMGQTEAPLIVKPYVTRMTRLELLALMVGGMATISGGMMAVYIGIGADPVAILATSVMAAPCGLYLSKLVYPEEDQPETRGEIETEGENPYRNAVDAVSHGAGDGLKLALNVAAMLIAFLALIAFVDYLLAAVTASPSIWDLREQHQPAERVMTVLGLAILYGLAAMAVRFVWIRYGPDWLRGLDGWGKTGLAAGGFFVFVMLWQILLPLLPGQLSLAQLFAWIFAPLAFLIGVDMGDIPAVADLLGTKLVANEFVAFIKLTNVYKPDISTRSFILSTYALTGFANFGSVGIQLGGIGAMAPERRSDLAQLGTRALLIGFLATMINAAMAGMFL